MDLEIVRAQLRKALSALLAAAGLKPGEILVIGCSTSEVLGRRMGTSSSMEVAEALMAVFLEAASREKICLAVQCCEHLNRALVVERQTMLANNLEEVAVVPVLHAGGALAAAAYSGVKEPVVVEAVQAHAGLDIGGTLVGMHLRPVVVPVPSEVQQIGQATLNMARTRPKYIGGERAVYEPVRKPGAQEGK